MKNIDNKTVEGFGDEWSRFDQTGMSEQEAKKVFEEYFSIFPWNDLPNNAEGFDMGCGSGRWARFVAPMVGVLHCIEPSNAIIVVKKNLSKFNNVNYYRASADDNVLPLNSQDFGYSLGVLHHVPDTQSAITSCVSFLKPRAPLLLYLYYAFDNRPWWFRVIWKISDLIRRLISKFPYAIKHILTDLIAIFVYIPLVKVSSIIEYFDFNVDSIPLSYYRNHSFYTIRTDAHDRFATPLEQRFTKAKIEKMMKESGLKDIHFSDSMPFWCVVGIKR
mgnify:FL=1